LRLEVILKGKKGCVMRICIAVFVVFLISNSAVAGNVAQQVVRYRVDPINEISINGGSNSLVIDIGKDSRKTEGSAFWAITTNETDKRVMGSLDADMPPGVELLLELETPEGAVSKGSVSLSIDPQGLVTNISRVAQRDLKLTYKVITQTGAPEADVKRVITLVLTDVF
jgi:hypothetical protein